MSKIYDHLVSQLNSLLTEIHGTEWGDRLYELESYPVLLRAQEDAENEIARRIYHGDPLDYEEGDYRLRPGELGVWIGVDNIDVRVRRDDGGVAVELWDSSGDDWGEHNLESVFVEYPPMIKED